MLLTGEVATPAAHDALAESLEATAEVDGVGTLGDRADATSVVSVLASGRRGGRRRSLPSSAQLGVEPDLTVAPDADVEAIYELLLDEVADDAEEVLARGGRGWSARVERAGRASPRTRPSSCAPSSSTAFEPVADAGVEVVVTSQQLVQASVSERSRRRSCRPSPSRSLAVMALLALFFGVRHAGADDRGADRAAGRVRARR